jgi:hypothetical protein
MTARTSIARLADDAPVARPESWVARKVPGTNWVEIRHPYIDEAKRLEAIWRRNMARRDADAAKYGEPRNPNEFYRGRTS